MIIDFPIDRDLAELLVDALETYEGYNYSYGWDFAVLLRKRFAMGKQPEELPREQLE